ncbi:hemin-degrading factor [Lujinxingia sediminis]|uniref:Hemin-degrading factor n=1 Tax=Lujinxingia sediminis TaxID=2480984 RepID=A0ABY0CVJ7_9DELT|nr:ChuX/HutX family heme-like substrate-binding protein [Lujinxingia sediminis]RVU46823.1 hemin-degrading factor [Lujinxingia sediminis]
MLNTHTTESSHLLNQLLALKENEPTIRARRAAERLGVSEGELLASQVGQGVVRLEGDFKEMIKGFEAFGEVMALTRNASAVHEVHGRYEDISFDGQAGLVLNPMIDLRLFMWSWHHGFAVEVPFRNGVRKSLQFFDIDGTAVHKVYLTKKSDEAAWDSFVQEHTAADQTPHLEAKTKKAKDPETPDAEIDREAFETTWRELQDTHDFFGMLREFGVTRTQAMRLAPEGYARKVSNESAVTVLEKAREQELPIMVFVGSKGCIQIYSGQVNKLVRTGEWFNVLDPAFNLHLKDGDIAQAWVVTKPTVDGDVTALEVFDKDGEVIALFFGARKPGIPEIGAWRELAHAL